MGNLQRVCICLVCLYALNATAQPDSLWSRTYGGSGEDYCFSIIQTTDGGYVLAGATESFGSGWQDFWIVKTDMYGDSLWSRLYGGDNIDECYAIQQTTDGGYVLAGKTESFGSGGSDFWLVKTNSNGDSLWSRTFGGSGTDECMAVLQTADGGYVLAGHTRSFGGGSDDFWLVRTDANGDSLWSHTFGSFRGEKCYSIQQTVDNGFLLAGSVSPYNYWLVKADANGDSLWSLTLGGSEWDICRSMVVASDAGIALGGYTMSYGAGASDFWLVKISPDPALPAPPQAFRRVIPADSSLVGWPLDTYAWTRSIDPNGDEVTYLFHLESNSSGWDTLDFSTQDTILMFDWFQPNGALDELFTFHWTVHAAAAGDTTEASNGEGIYFFDTPEPPGDFTRVLPADNSELIWTVEQPTVEFAWTTSIDPNGDPVAYVFHVESPTFAGIEPASAVLTDTTITVEISLPVEPLDDIHTFYWTVFAAANFDTVEATNGEGHFTMDIPEAADEELAVPTEYSLSVYPNPFNPSTTISFDVPQQSQITLTAYDLLGREITQLVNGTITAGAHQINWDCSTCATGLYLIELRSGSHRSITKAMLLR
ncbi:T9SS type A sorting domain-containing protein [bacterium]|nr:T9SS type A sorting domain-containing protein [bacterium]MBU1920980.1 T9SS type A sorting domain-containing protein [bacterium]